MNLSSLKLCKAEVAGNSFEFRICEGLKSEREAEIIRSKLRRDEKCLSKISVIIEEFAPLQPNIVDGVQEGWFCSDSSFKVAVFDRPKNPGDYSHIASILGFCPNLKDGTLDHSFVGLMADLLSRLPSRTHLYLGRVSQSSAVMTIEKGQCLTTEDARVTMDFNERVFQVTYKEVPKIEYMNIFIANGVLIFGTCF